MFLVVVVLFIGVPLLIVTLLITHTIILLYRLMILCGT